LTQADKPVLFTYFDCNIVIFIIFDLCWHSSTIINFHIFKFDWRGGLILAVVFKHNFNFNSNSFKVFLYFFTSFAKLSNCWLNPGHWTKKTENIKTIHWFKASILIENLSKKILRAARPRSGWVMALKNGTSKMMTVRMSLSRGQSINQEDRNPL